ncbi:MAG: Abi-alpha family protein [Syntrophales bacterium]|nr:Abi-alpha family protein [Syntrophales bacterium]
MEDLAGIGKLSESIEKGTKEIRQLAYDFLAPGLKEAGQLLADKVRFSRIDNAALTLKKAIKLIADSGLSLHPVDLKTLVPLIEYSSLEDDQSMVDKWAGLLASAAAFDTPMTAYVHILAELSAVDAKTFDFICTTPEVSKKSDEIQIYGVRVQTILESLKLEKIQLLPVIGNLGRLGLIQRVLSDGAMFLGEPPLGVPKNDVIGPTSLGQCFIQACEGPKTNQ